MTHSDLVDIAHRWVLRKSGCGVSFKEIKTYATTEIPDVIGFGGWGYSVLVECKTSRADYFRDRKKDHCKMGKYRFYCTPIGLIRPDELPDGYGLIEVSEKGKIQSIFNPFNKLIGTQPSHEIGSAQRHSGHQTSMTIERNFMYSILRRKKEKK